MDELLRLDVQLLLCRYGRQKVLSALAELESCRTEEIAGSIAKLRAKKETAKKRASRKTLVETLEEGLCEAPDRLAILRPFAIAYENGTLFPTLKGVQRFVESRGEGATGLKSRKAAGPFVLKALARMSGADLDDLGLRISRDGESDYSLLSGAILRTRERA